MSTLLGLADYQLKHAALRSSEAGAPLDIDGQPDREGPAIGSNPALVADLDAVLEIGPMLGALLCDLRQREFDLAARIEITLPVVELMHVLCPDSDGHIHGGVTAVVRREDDAFFGIPLDAPIDVPALNLTSGLSLDDRVRVLGELVRLFSDAVGDGRLSDGVRRQVVRSLGVLVGLLRVAIRDYCTEQSSNSDDRADKPQYIHGRSIPDPDATRP